MAWRCDRSAGVALCCSTAVICRQLWVRTSRTMWCLLSLSGLHAGPCALCMSTQSCSSLASGGWACVKGGLGVRRSGVRGQRGGQFRTTWGVLSCRRWVVCLCNRCGAGKLVFLWRLSEGMVTVMSCVQPSCTRKAVVAGRLAAATGATGDVTCHDKRVGFQRLLLRHNPGPELSGANLKEPALEGGLLHTSVHDHDQQGYGAHSHALMSDEVLDAVALARPPSPREQPLGPGCGAGPCAWRKLGSPLQVYMYQTGGTQEKAGRPYAGPRVETWHIHYLVYDVTSGRN
jgi:hypothetical protein